MFRTADSASAKATTSSSYYSHKLLERRELPIYLVCIFCCARHVFLHLQDGIICLLHQSLSIYTYIILVSSTLVWALLCADCLSRPAFSGLHI